MKLTSQAKILKAHGFRFYGIRARYRKHPKLFYESPQGHSLIRILRSFTMRDLQREINRALESDIEWTKTASNRRARNARSRFKCVDGGASSWLAHLKRRSKASLVLIRGAA